MNENHVTGVRSTWHSHYINNSFSSWFGLRAAHPIFNHVLHIDWEVITYAMDWVMPAPLLWYDQWWTCQFECVWWHDVQLSGFLHCRLTATCSSKPEVQGQSTSLFSYKTLLLCSWNNELVGKGPNILWISCFLSFNSHEISRILDVNACINTKSRQSWLC